MNAAPSNKRLIGFYFIAIAGTFLIFAWLVSFVRQYTLPPPLNQARAEERRKALAEVTAANAQALNNYGWVDQSKGAVQLPVSVAMQLTVKEWQQPAAARAKMITLSDKLFPPEAQPAPSAAPPGGAPKAPGTQPGAAAGTNAPPAAPAPTQK